MSKKEEEVKKTRNRKPSTRKSLAELEQSERLGDRMSRCLEGIKSFQIQRKKMEEEDLKLFKNRIGKARKRLETIDNIVDKESSTTDQKNLYKSCAMYKVAEPSIDEGKLDESVKNFIVFVLDNFNTKQSRAAAEPVTGLFEQFKAIDFDEEEE